MDAEQHVHAERQTPQAKALGMKLLTGLLLLGLCIEFVAAPSAFGQLRGSLGGGVRGGGTSGTRSGSGFRNNPIANPAPSLTPHQLFNPRGSLSAGQVLNPAPSLSRPRSGISTAPVNRIDPFRRPGTQDAQMGSAAIKSADRTATPSSADRQIDNLAAALERQTKRNAGTRELRQSELALRAAQFEQVLRTYPNGDKWVRYFRLSEAGLADPDGKSDQNSGQQLQSMLARFEKINNDPRYEEVSSLRIFEAAHTALASCIKVNSADESGGESKPAAAVGEEAPRT